MEKEKKIYDLFQQKEMNLQKKGEDFYKKELIALKLIIGRQEKKKKGKKG